MVVCGKYARHSAAFNGRTLVQAVNYTLNFITIFLFKTREIPIQFAHQQEPILFLL